MVKIKTGQPGVSSACICLTGAWFSRPGSRFREGNHN